MNKKALYGSTDYPIERLGDTPGRRAPRRNVKIISYDLNKYVQVEVYAGGGVSVIEEIKSGYIRPYDWKKRKGRWRDYSHKELCALPVTR